MKNIRNFVIISHIDHGKSTLADRFLEITGTVSQKEMKPQFLDSMDLERERGITIKMQPVRMVFNSQTLKNSSEPESGLEDNLKNKIENKIENKIDKNQEFILNLIDTPGHVDFSYEVSRALAAVEGAILLVDASKGIQAQTIANLELAQKAGLVIIPVVNKIDLDYAMVKESAKELADLLGISPEEIIKISAKNNVNIEEVLSAVIKKVPAPKEKQGNFKALIFDSEYDSYKGVVAYVRVAEGEIIFSESIGLCAGNIASDIKELGYFSPKMVSQKKLSSGEIGYIATGIKEPGKVRVGDTIFKKGEDISPLYGYKEPKPMVFASFYPESADDFNDLKDALSRLKLSDPALVFEIESKEALGRGFRCGFLGTLHIEIISERLRREFGLNLVISTPSVVYKILDKKEQEFLIYSTRDWPEQPEIKETLEPWVFLEIVAPVDYFGRAMEVMKNMRGNYIDTEYIGSKKVILKYETPLSEIITNFYDDIKNATQGYASISYNLIGFRKGNLVKMDIFIAGHKEEAFSRIIPEEKAFQEGRILVKKLKETLPSQQFAVALQAALAGKIIARETISSRRKDVTAGLYGGDYSRKRKQLQKQKKGKKLLKEAGKVKIPPDVFFKVYRSK